VNGKIETELLAKYSGGERKRVNAVKADIVAEEGVKPVMEELKNIGEKIRCGRRVNRRLRSMPFRKIQFSIGYKSMEQGCRPEYVEAENTSKTRPICGDLNKLNGQVFKCERCDFQADRHLAAAWNIAAKLPMRRSFTVGGESHP